MNPIEVEITMTQDDVILRGKFTCDEFLPTVRYNEDTAKIQDLSMVFYGLGDEDMFTYERINNE